jgi:hypothetical protein
MLNAVIAYCTSTGGLLWLLMASDLTIAFAYFAIPVTMALVLSQRKDDIPYPWLWTLFVAFIVACGLTHVVHMWSAYRGIEYLGLQATIEVITAGASLATAVAFALVLPQIKMLPSPRQQQAHLQTLIAERTREKDQLIREINHRVGNQIQVLSSIVSIESRNAEGQEAIGILQRLKAQLDEMAKEHVKRSQQDYLDAGVAATDGAISATGSSAAPAPASGAVR